MIDSTFPHKVGVPKFAALCEAQNWRCAYCGIRCDGDGCEHDAPSRDHVVPLAAGGTRTWDNEVMACRLCNNGRGAIYARKYFQMVQRKGREKAARWNRKRYSKRCKQRNLRKREAQKVAATQKFLAEMYP